MKIVPADNDISWQTNLDLPSCMIARNRGSIDLVDDGTHFGFVASGVAEVANSSGSFRLSAGMYFSIPGRSRVEMDGQGFIATRLGWQGFFQIGGPIEEQGRLQYIDGCSDSLLISPVVWGDPCLNFLYLPPHTNQTAHTHPSVRFGIIASGSGTCKTPEKDYPLLPGMVFWISPGEEHSFHTGSSSLRVIAWHPDSDFGPEHHDHPMINRTIIQGLPATKQSPAVKQFRNSENPE